MTIRLNGTRQEMAPGATLADAVAQVTTDTDGIAVACNDEVVRRGDWTSTLLADGDRVEVVTARQGG